VAEYVYCIVGRAQATVTSYAHSSRLWIRILYCSFLFIVGGTVQLRLLRYRAPRRFICIYIIIMTTGPITI